MKSENPNQPTRLSELRAKALVAPTEPGIYQMCDANGKILYVGKAKNLRKRVSSYFRESGHERALTQLLVNNIVEIRFITTQNESEALLLENTLIKKERPKYNISLKDDKEYVCLRLSVKHRFPRLTIVRRPKPDGAKYYGPFISAWAIRKMARYLLKLFPLRSCSDHAIKNRSRPCILYDIKLCTAPCVGKINDVDYAVLVEQVKNFLEGNSAPLIQGLKKEMKKAAAETDFDRAAEIRDRLQALEASQVHQHVIFHDQRDVDVVGMERQGQSMSVVILTLREGKILGKREVLCELVDEDHAAEILETILLQHYSTGMVFIPPQVLLPIPLPTQESLRKTLAETSGHKVTLLCPSRGGRASLVELAQQNAASHLQQMYSKQSATERLLAQIQQEFSLSTSPHRIECYDISNMQGTDAVGSQVTFIDGQPAKQFYRKYKIKFVEGPNDFAMLQEVLSRRFREADPVNYPQLVLIDGGKGQLSSVEAVMNFLNLREIPLASIAKVPEDGLNKNILTDRIFIPGRKNPLNLRQDNPVLRLMQQMRDEAHRFAVAYHHKTKQKRTIISELSQIPGVGPKRQKQLLQKFGSVETIKQKTVVELQAAGTIDQKTAQKIYDYFHRTA